MTRTHTHTFNRTARFAALAALALALFAGSGIAATPASARVNGPVFDSFSAACLSLQSQADDLRAEYSRVGRENPYSPRLGEILAELRNIGGSWNQIGCGAVFGSIALSVVQPPPIGPVYVGNLGVQQALPVPVVPGFAPTGGVQDTPRRMSRPVSLH